MRKLTMNPIDHSLLELARRINQEAPLTSPRGREILEMTLMPIVRVALRSGVGPEPVVRWVHRQIPPGRPVDLARTARVLVRELSERLLARMDPIPGRDTILGP